MRVVPRRRLIALACGALACSLAPHLVRAEGVQTLQTIEVVGTEANTIGIAESATQGALGARGLRARPTYRPGALLEAMPGLIVTQHSGEGKANQYFLRGFNLDHGTDLAIFVDGMPVNMRTHAHGQGYADLSFLIPELVERVVYKKGPYFAEEGDFSSAGSARVGLFDQLPGHTAIASAGSFGYRRALLAGSPAEGGPKLVYGLEYVETDGPWTRPDNLGKLNGMLRFGQGNAANGFSVTAMGYRGRWSATHQIPQRALDSGLINRFDTLDPSDGGRAERYNLSGQWRRTSGSGITRLAAYGIRSRLNLFSNFTYFLNDPVNGDQFEQSDQRAILGTDLAHTWLGQWAGRPVENTVGLDTRSDRIRVGLFNTLERSRTSTTRDDRVTQSSAGLYLQNRVTWSDWFRSVTGVRGDYMRASVSSDTAENSGRASDRLFSPKLGLIFGPWSKTEYYLNWGRGFHSNDARGATITIDPVTQAPADRVPLLVRSRGEELGVRSAVLPNLVLTAALFRLDFNSELLFVGDAGNTEAARASRRIGGEITARYSPLPWLLFDLDYAQTRARFREDDGTGRSIPGAPDRVVSFKAIVDSFGPWFGSASLRHFGARPLVEDNSVRSRSTTLLSGKLGYRFDKRIAVELSGFNLLNRRANQIDYFYESRLRGEAAGVADVHFHPVEPRSFRLALIASF
jgi:hypothetical protein